MPIAGIMGRLSDWERNALSFVGHTLGLWVGIYDAGGRQGAPDGAFVREGRTGYVEVTTWNDPTVAEGEALYWNKFEKWQPNGLSWSAVVYIDPVVRVSEFRRHVPILVAACEAGGATSVRDVLGKVPAASAAWFLQHDSAGQVQVLFAPDEPGPGTIYVTPWRPSGGVASRDPNVLLLAIAETLASPVVKKRLAKLGRTGDAEQHLFVTVTGDVWDWEPFDFLERQRGDPPSSPPAVPDHLDGLWLMTRLSRSALVWIRGDGWAWVSLRGWLDAYRIEA